MRQYCDGVCARVYPLLFLRMHNQTVPHSPSPSLLTPTPHSLPLISLIHSVLAGQPGGDPELRETALRAATLLSSAGSAEWGAAQVGGWE